MKPTNIIKWVICRFPTCTFNEYLESGDFASFLKWADVTHIFKKSSTK